jgi:hypothetical protein
MRQCHVHAAAQHVRVFQLDAGRIGAAAAPEVETGIQCPHVFRRDHHVDLAVVIAHRTDPGVVEIPFPAQDALGLIQQTSRVMITWFEEQVVTDDTGAGLQVQVVREPK